MNGCQFAGLMKNAPTTMKAMITVTLIATMMLLTVADSETPITSSTVTPSVTNTAGRLNTEGTTADAAIGITAPLGNCTIDCAGTFTTVPAASSRKVVVAGSMTFVAAASVACVSALTAMSSELISAKPPSFAALTTSYCAIEVVKSPVMVAVPTEKNCTRDPSASDAVTPFNVTIGSVKASEVIAATTILPCGCVSAAGMSTPMSCNRLTA